MNWDLPLPHLPDGSFFFSWLLVDIPNSAGQNGTNLVFRNALKAETELVSSRSRIRFRPLAAMMRTAQTSCLFRSRLNPFVQKEQSKKCGLVKSLCLGTSSGTTCKDKQ